MRELTYREFLDLVKVARGPFSYLFSGLGRMVCDPVLHKAVQYPRGFPGEGRGDEA